MFKKTARDQATDSRLTLRQISDNLCLTQHEAWAWFRLPTQPWAFRSDGQREQLLFGFGDAMSWLAGRRLHLRVTSRPYPSADWAKGLHGVTPDPLQTAGVESRSDHMVRMQKHLRHQTMAEKEVFLGVRLARQSTHSPHAPRAVGSAGGLRAEEAAPRGVDVAATRIHGWFRIAVAGRSQAVRRRA